MWRRSNPTGFGMFVILALASCSSSPGLLTHLVEAQRLAAEMHVDFTRSYEASNRAVMADTDDAARAAADEARQARRVVERNLESLHSLLTSLGYSDDSASLEKFRALFTQYRKLDDEILPLAVENSNPKVQRMAFGVSNVQSLALALGRKRTVTAECEDQLKALEEILARHEFTATR